MAFKTVIRVTKLSKIGNIKASGEHTWRERQTDNADPTRTHLNEDWRVVKSSVELVDAIQSRVAQAEQKSDKPVLCIEYLITANKNAFKEGGGETDSAEYFADSLKWLEAKHGKDNIVAVNIQRDEQAPHMVAYVVPLVEVEAKTRKRSVVIGKDLGGKQIREVREYKDAPIVRLSAAEFLDGRKKLRDMQTDFSEAVGKKHNLERGIEGSNAEHQSIKTYYGRVNDAIPKSPRITIPEPSWKDNISPKEYGKRVANLVLDQIEPKWHSLQAKAGEMAAAQVRAKAAEDVVRQAQNTAKRERERADDLSAKVHKQALILEQLTPSEMQAVVERSRQQTVRDARRSKEAEREAAAAARSAAMSAEVQRRVEAIKSPSTRLYGMKSLYQEIASNALREAGGDANKVYWPRVDDHAATKAIRDNGESPEEVVEVLRNCSPWLANPAYYPVMDKWIGLHAADLQAEYKAEREQGFEM